MVAAIQKGLARGDTSIHLLRCLWFFVSHYDIDITIVHVAGVTNCTADHLSRHHMSLFFSQFTGGYRPYHTPSSSQGYCGITEPGLDFSKLQATTQHYYSQGLAPLTHKCYRVGQLHYITFCNHSKRTPIQTTQMTLLLFIAHIDKEGLVYTSIKVYLSAIRIPPAIILFFLNSLFLIWSKSCMESRKSN